MPSAAPKPCRQAGCKAHATSGAYCLEHKRKVEQQYDEKRGSSFARGYNRRWRKARETYLRSHPLCVEHERRGLVAASVIVDHIIPHEGDQALFWDTNNWQALCKPCHDGWKQKQEAAGKLLYRKRPG